MRLEKSGGHAHPGIQCIRFSQEYWEEGTNREWFHSSVIYRDQKREQIVSAVTNLWPWFTKLSILSIGRNLGEDEEARPEVTQNSGEGGLSALVVMSCSNCLCQFRKLVAILPANTVVAIFPNLNIIHNCLKHVRASNCSFEQFCSNFALQIPLFPEHRDQLLLNVDIQGRAFLSLSILQFRLSSE